MTETKTVPVEPTREAEMKSCPLCGALPCDWVDDPFKPSGLHPATADLVHRFSQALAAKLLAAEQKYGYSDGWLDPTWQEACQRHLAEHVAKGDPRDVAAYAAFCWHHGWSTAAPSPQVGREEVARIIDPSGWRTRDISFAAIDEMLADGRMSADRAHTAKLSAEYYIRRSLAKADAILSLINGGK